MDYLVVPEIEAYAEAHSTAESDVCRRLREETYRTMEWPQMVVGPLEGAFLKMMAQLVRATNVLEIGMFTGYSALCFAEAIPSDGRVITCEVEAKPAAVARRYMAQSPHGRKIDIRMGPALDTLREVSGPFDLIFIDADKVNYPHYYERALDLIAPTGVILLDNALRNGEVLERTPSSPGTAAIQELNRRITDDSRVCAVLVTIRDGVMVVRPKRSP
jgi:caffeoyl-CoA O-methyltransferase